MLKNINNNLIFFCIAITCEKPSVKNGTVKYTNDKSSLENEVVAFGVIASFICEEGHVLRGNSTMTCHYGVHDTTSTTGNWTGEIPQCERKELYNGT